MFEKFSTQNISEFFTQCSKKFRHEVFEKFQNRNIFRLKYSIIFQPKRSKNVRLEGFKKIDQKSSKTFRSEMFEKFSIRNVWKISNPKVRKKPTQNVRKNFDPKYSNIFRLKMLENFSIQNVQWNGVYMIDLEPFDLKPLDLKAIWPNGHLT